MKLFWLADEDFPEGIEDRAGVYTVHARTETGEFKQIPRLLGCNPKGILFTGKSVRVRTRIRTFKKAATIRDWRKVPHSEGRTYRWIPALQERFPIERLYVSVHYTDTPEVEESRRLRDYAFRFGEPPPLNLSVGQDRGRRR